MKKLFMFIIILLSCSFLNVYALDDLEITSITVIEQSGSITVENLDYSNNTINSNITFNEVGDFVTLRVTLKNNSNDLYQLDSISNQLDEEYFSIESNTIGKNILKGDTDTFNIKITYKKQLLNEAERTLVNPKISFNFIENNVLINPPTKNGISMFIKLLLTINIIVSGSILLKRTKKLKLAFILLLLIPLYVFAKEERIVSISFTNMKYKGVFEVYDITIDDGNGNTTVISRQYGTKVEDLPVPERIGYLFVSWIDGSGNIIEGTTEVTGEISITATYEVINYQISYNLDGGTLEEENPSIYTVEDEFTLNNPSKVGYSFLGWSEGTSTELSTSITVYKGTAGSKTYTAHFSANETTPYKVIHKKMKLDGTYDSSNEATDNNEVQNLTGVTDSSVTPQRKGYYGYIIPNEETITISGDGSTVLIYYYPRKQFTFEITDRTYVDNNYSTPDGTYYFGYNVRIKAQERAGYSFKWNTKTTISYSLMWAISQNESIAPIYTANTDTPYKVIHKKMNMDETTYTVADTQNKTGKTDSTVTPPVNTYEGFTAPQTQTVTINGNGTTEVIYLYTRNKYQLTLTDSEFIETTTPSGRYLYGTSINLKAKDRTYYSFIKWSDESTNINYTFTLTENKTIGPVYSHDKFTVTFNPNGENETVDPPSKEVYGGDAIGELPTPTTTKNHKTFLGWYTNLSSTGEEVTTNTIITGNIEIYAKWDYHPESTFDIGQNVNAKMKKIAGTANASYNTDDLNIEQIKLGSGLPSGFISASDNIVSSSNSDEPIYIWYDSNNKFLYYYTDADTINLQSNTSNMFYYYKKLETIEGISSWNTSQVTNMDQMFYGAGKNATTFELNLSTWDTSNVISMNSVFANAGQDAATWSIGDLSNWNVSNVTSMENLFFCAGYSATSWSIGNLSNWKVSKVENMRNLFAQSGFSAPTWNIGNLSNWNTSSVINMNQFVYRAGYNATTWNMGDLSNWNTINVTNMSSMFDSAGKNATTWNIGNLSNWNVTNVTNMYSMFSNAGYSATTWSIGDLSNWNVSNVTGMGNMFSNAGYSASTFKMNLSNWNVTNVKTMNSMFYYAGYKATTFDIGNLSNWNVSNVTTMGNMFSSAGRNATTWNIGNLSNWNVSSVKNMSGIFSSAGYKATTWSIGDLSGWNVSNVTNMSSMFSSSGHDATTWNIGDLSNWNTSNVTEMSSMFSSAGYNATTWTSIGTIKVYATNLSSFFSNCKNAKATINIYNKPTNFNTAGMLMLLNAATDPSALITVNYTAEVDNIDDIIATKSSNSNVVKGSLITTS